MLAESIVKALVQEQKTPGKHQGVYSVCVSGAREVHEAAAQKVKEVEESLADLFSDVE
jgi:hypothetical protein